MINANGIHVKPAVVRIRGVIQMTGLGRSTVYAYLKSNGKYFDSNFPRPIALGGRSRGWLVEEVERWITAKADQRMADGIVS